MAVRGETTYSVQQEERIAEIKNHTDRLRKFLRNGNEDESAFTVVTSEGWPAPPPASAEVAAVAVLPEAGQPRWPSPPKNPTALSIDERAVGLCIC